MSLKNIKTQLTLSEPWLSFKRVRFYSILLFIIYLFAFGRLIYDSDFARPGGNTIFLDFRTAWASASLAKNGEASSAYNPAVINQYVWGSMPPYLNKTRVVTPDPNAGQREVFWLYPPTFFFSILPIGMLSFFVAYFIYMLLTAFSFFSLLKFILPKWSMVFCFAALPSVWANLALGQHGFLIASLAGWAVLLIDRRPLLAGILIGLLSIKPHLALMFPIALISIGAWRSLLMALSVAILLTALSLSTLGLDVAYAWIASLKYASNILEFDALKWSYSPSTFALARLLNVSMSTSYLYQFFVALVIAVFLWKFWSAKGSWEMKGAALLTGTLMISPYIFDYDLIVLAIPIALVIKSALRTTWLPFEKEVLLLAGVLPLAIIPIGILTSIQVGPLVMALLLLVIIRRQRYFSLPTPINKGLNT